MRNNLAVCILASLLGGVAGHSLAASGVIDDEIRVLGLFKDAALLSINDQQRMLRVGDHNKDMRLLTANSDRAVLEYRGTRLQLQLSDAGGIVTGLPSTGTSSAHLISNGGLYSITGSINGQLADFVMDTGASYITMSAQQADQLRLDYSNAKKIMINTANGKATAHVFTIKRVRIGGIELQDVEAAVMHNLESPKILLGMSFLSQVDMSQSSGLMVLKHRN